MEFPSFVTLLQSNCRIPIYAFKHEECVYLIPQTIQLFSNPCLIDLLTHSWIILLARMFLTILKFIL